MKKSNINFSIELDQNNVPEKIYWNADEKEDEGFSETKSVSISLWDDSNKNTLRMDLWTKEMPADEMKRFCIDSIGGLAQSLLTATGDEYMSNEMNNLCDKLTKYLKKQN